MRLIDPAASDVAPEAIGCVADGVPLARVETAETAPLHTGARVIGDPAELARRLAWEASERKKPPGLGIVIRFNEVTGELEMICG